MGRCPRTQAHEIALNYKHMSFLLHSFMQLNASLCWLEFVPFFFLQEHEYNETSILAISMNVGEGKSPMIHFVGWLQSLFDTTRRPL
jgi:hypothetical protein